MTQITSEALLVSQLFLKGRFTVPWHQRYYDWAVEQVAELLVDLRGGPRRRPRKLLPRVHYARRRQRGLGDQ